MNTAKIKTQLEHEKERLENEITQLELDDPANNQFRDSNNNDDDDSSEDSENHLRIQTRIEDNRTSIQNIVRALKRIEEGTYGKCERCGKDIPEARLEIVPWARYDIECEEIIESGRR